MRFDPSITEKYPSTLMLSLFASVLLVSQWRAGKIGIELNKLIYFEQPRVHQALN